MGSFSQQSIVTNQGSGRRFFKRACTRLVLDGAFAPDPYDGMMVYRKDLQADYIYDEVAAAWRQVLELSATSGAPDGTKYLRDDRTWSPLIIENRTSDPGSPVTGQVWLRTDL